MNGLIHAPTEPAGGPISTADSGPAPCATDAFSALDRAYMRMALEMAAHARDSLNEVPVGAVLVLGERVLGYGFNSNISRSDPTAHAEIVALRSACGRLKNYRLPPGACLYVTLEPCAMCAMALIHARITRVVYAADDPKSGAAGSVFDTLISERHNHRVTVHRGLMAARSAAMLRQFFRERRAAQKPASLPS